MSMPLARAITGLGLLLGGMTTLANPSTTPISSPQVVRMEQSVASDHYPVILPGHLLAPIHGMALNHIGVYALTALGPTPIPFQIDRRADNGQYQLGYAGTQHDPERTLTEKDEMVFMAGDMGTTAGDLALRPDEKVVMKIDVGLDQTRRVVYITTHTHDAPRSAIDHVQYDARSDSVQTAAYRIGFFREHPFLVETLHWRERDTNGYGENLADSMKVRHRGKLFGRYDFIRTEADYSSRLVAFTDGPVRVIRQTRNKVRVFGFLRSPSVDMDYVLYANHVVMDTTLDFPFKIGWFFTDVTTFASLDLAGTQATRLYSPKEQTWLTMTGEMSANKSAYNASAHKEFALSHPQGVILGSMYLSKNLPITWHTHVVDDTGKADPPEKIAGQFGNIGFMTDNWDKVDTGIHHLYYSFYFLPGDHPDKVLHTLKSAPGYAHNTP